jgi:8-oxo-dGTP pyrophosphatase MutT (NUDIX family)
MDHDRRVADLLAVLSGRLPLDSEEEEAVAQLRHLLRCPADPFARTTLPTHVTASAIVVDERDGHILLHLHRRLDRWLQPGGHIELGERPEDAAVRESIEETGLFVQHPPHGPILLHVDEHPGPDGHVHLDLRFLLTSDRTAPPAAVGETTGEGDGPTLRWVTPDDGRRIADRSLARAIDAFVRHAD